VGTVAVVNPYGPSIAAALPLQPLTTLAARYSGQPPPPVWILEHQIETQRDNADLPIIADVDMENILDFDSSLSSDDNESLIGGAKWDPMDSFDDLSQLVNGSHDSLYPFMFELAV